MAAPSRILVPVDLTEGSRAVLDYALQLARSFGATVDVIHVWEPPQYVAPDLLVAAPGWNSLSLEQVAVDTARKEMTTLLQGLEVPPVPVKQRVLVGEAASTILELAEKEGFDLVVMGTHGRRGLPRLLLGSVAQKLVSRSSCPVLTLHVAAEKK
ncbi:universal stress protein [Myxococcus stipitatus]|uniref:universal stress protein n=1 Tax=Myxococcus stipitatus TaxID=83455 RepID=UPI001F28B767|nr:universal stress protein [Myxococcus stipitatus]MCE9670182.1 universal stress protein [Myxococcus stipitatus]